MFPNTVSLYFNIYNSETTQRKEQHLVFGYNIIMPKRFCVLQYKLNISMYSVITGIVLAIKNIQMFSNKHTIIINKCVVQNIFLFS